MIDHEGTPFEEQFARLLQMMAENDIAGATISGDGAIIGMPDWSERTKDQRFTEKSKTHGYPKGLAKREAYSRYLRAAKLRDEVVDMGVLARTAFDAMYAAMAYAVDAEYFLGSFSGVDRDELTQEHVEFVAENLITWLRERGFNITPIAGFGQGPEPNSPGTEEDGSNSDDMLSEERYNRRFGRDAWDVELLKHRELTNLGKRFNRWRDMRLSHKDHTKRKDYYPFSSAKKRRRDLIDRYRADLYQLSAEDRMSYRAAHEALAYSVDAERYLGGLPDIEATGDLATLEINSFTNRVLVWLRDCNYKLVPITSTDESIW